MTFRDCFCNIAHARSRPSLLILILVVSACAIFDKGPAGTPDIGSKPTDVAINEPDLSRQQPDSACTNDYYPIDPAFKRAYKSSGTRSSAYVLSQAFSGEHGFTETRAFASGTEVKNNWVCSSEGLRNAEYKNTMSMHTGNAVMETVSSSGVTFPKTWELGSEWSASYVVKVKLNAGPVSADADGYVRIANKLAALNETVEAGDSEFKAARIDSVIEIDMKMRGRNLRGTKLNSTIWLAPNIGIVRQESSGSFGKETIEYQGRR